MPPRHDGKFLDALGPIESPNQRSESMISKHGKQKTLFPISSKSL
jgi:hypothetical protein